MREEKRSRVMRSMGIGIVSVLVLSVGTAQPARADNEYATDFGLGVGTVFCDLVYMPAKLVYATLGGLTGGFAFILTGGKVDTAKAIWRPSLGGTYVITPSMLRGDDPIYFSGRADEPAQEERRERPSTEEPLGDRDRGRGPY